MNIIDTALIYDPVRRRCDLAFENGDFQFDDGPVTPVLTAVFLDRRALPDDQVPDPTIQTYAPATLNARRGWAMDFLDPNGRPVGSRMWLLTRAKQSEPVRLAAESYLREALEPLANARGWPMSLMVRWIATGILAWRVTVGQVTLSINQQVT